MVYSKTLKAKILLANFPNSTGYLIAYSGGADSTALLHLMATEKNVRAIHINHGLQDEADDWQHHCKKTCKQLNIPLLIEQANLKNSSESACREARYDFFRKHIKTDEMLLTAHHAQDQAETVLLKLLRGTGIKGLSGISAMKKFTHGTIGRPLLNTDPKTLRDYLISNQIDWIEDPSNKISEYNRNFLRNEIFPALEIKFPNAIANINRSAGNCSESLALLDNLSHFKEDSLALKKLQDLPKKLRVSLMYQWLSSKNLPVPDRTTLQQLSHDFIEASADKNPHYKNKHYQISRWKQAIYCLKNYNVIEAKLRFQWHTDVDFYFPNNNGCLKYKGKGLELFEVKFNQNGERLQTHKHQFSKTIKQLFQENNIPLWERENTPYIYHNGELISLGYDWSHQEKFKGKIQYNPQDLLLY